MVSLKSVMLLLLALLFIAVGGYLFYSASKKAPDGTQGLSVPPALPDATHRPPGAPAP